MSDGDDRFEPMNFYSSAEDYYQSAVYIIRSLESGDLRLQFPLVVYYLFSHSVELALKGFLRTKGVSKKDLWKKYFHKRCKLITDCISQGLPLEKIECATAIKWLEEFDREAANFRYVRGGAISLTDIHSTKSNVKRILNVVRPACEQERDKPPTRAKSG